MGEEGEKERWRKTLKQRTFNLNSSSMLGTKWPVWLPSWIFRNSVNFSGWVVIQPYSCPSYSSYILSAPTHEIYTKATTHKIYSRKQAKTWWRSRKKLEYHRKHALFQYIYNHKMLIYSNIFPTFNCNFVFYTNGFT